MNAQKITWHLDSGRTIVKTGEGVQQVFATLTPSQRADITINCERVSTQAVDASGFAMTKDQLKACAEFELHASRAFFASAWADACEEAGANDIGPGTEIMDVMPDVIDPAAIHAARTLRMDIERANAGKGIEVLMQFISANGDGDRANTLEFFGHYAAMQAMGHGVGLSDAFGAEVYENVRIPYLEFGSHSLERDYFPRGE